MAKASAYTPGLTLNKDGTFTIRVSKVSKTSGKRSFRQGTWPPNMLRLAPRLRAQLVTELESEKDVAIHVRTMTVNQYLDLWLDWSLTTGTSRAYVVDTYKPVLDYWIRPHIGAAKIADFDISSLVHWKNEIAKMRQKGQKLTVPVKKTTSPDYSKRSRLHVWRILRAAINAAPNIIGHKIDIAGFRYSPTGAESAEKTWLTLEQLKSFLAAADNYHQIKIKAIVLVLFSTGIRFGEASALTWADVRMDGDNPHIVISKSSVRQSVNSTKTGNSRTVPLLPLVAKALLDYKDTYPPDRLGRVFYSGKGKYIVRSCVANHLTIIAAKAGIDAHIDCHCARRSMNNALRQAAGDVVARSILGHVTKQMTHHYSSVDIDERKRAVGGIFKDLKPEVIN